MASALLPSSNVCFKDEVKILEAVHVRMEILELADDLGPPVEIFLSETQPSANLTTKSG